MATKGMLIIAKYLWLVKRAHTYFLSDTLVQVFLNKQIEFFYKVI